MDAAVILIQTRISKTEPGFYGSASTYLNLKCSQQFWSPELTWFNTNDIATLETIGLATGRLQSQPLFFTVYFSNLVVVSDNSVGTKLTLCLSKHRLKLSYIGSDSRLILNI